MRKINELNTDELRKVFEVNRKLQEEVSEDMQESEMFWVDEILDVLSSGLSSWSIGFCNRNQHVKASDNERDFIEAVKDVQKAFCFMPDSYNEKVGELDTLVERYYETDVYTDEFDELEEQVEDAIREMERDITDQFTKQLDGLLGNHEEDHFIEFYAHERLNEDAYVNEDYELFEDVSYTKSYAV